MANAEKRPKFSLMLQHPAYQKLINNTLQDPTRARRFIASISSAVAVNPSLQECDAGTILSCALLGESLNLSPSPQLGQYYLVPFNDSKNKCKVATFILGYKGYIQLAVRSGQYKNINALAIKEGELQYFNPLTEEVNIVLIEDDIQRESKQAIGYIATFKLNNGFSKSIYWNRDKMEQHALRYSKGYATKTGYTFWEKDFDSMALKTMMRQLISKWGIMSIEMCDAFEADERTIANDLTPDYISAVDAPLPALIPAPEHNAQPISDATTGEDIEGASNTISFDDL